MATFLLGIYKALQLQMNLMIVVHLKELIQVGEILQYLTAITMANVLWEIYGS